MAKASENAARLSSERLSAETWRLGAGAAADARDVPQEAAIGIAYDSAPYVVVMGTPDDIEDLAIGFTVTERVAAFEDIERVSVAWTDEGPIADVLLQPGAGERVMTARRRTLETRSSCGLCGVETLREAVRPVARVGPGPTVTRRAIQAAVAGLEGRQPLGQLTRATHAAGWADAHGRLRLAREDVGRHNALDKLVGAALGEGLDAGQAIVVITSRCSYEMVEKAAAAGVAVLAAISAPTALAVRKAEEAGMTLVALARADGHMVFTGAQRITAP
jgi:FdhD protein